MTEGAVDIAPVTALCAAVLDQVERAVVGKRAAASWCSPAILAGGHVLLEDYPGPRQDPGRALVRPDARAASSAGRSSPPTCCPPTSPARSSTTSATASSTSGPGPLFTGLLLADEINRTPPKTQSALLEAMQERQVTVEGRTFRLAAAVPRAGHGQPGRVRGHLPAARGAARPVPAAGRVRLPDAARRSATCCAAGSPATRGGRARAGHRRRRAARACRRPSRRSTSTASVGGYCVALVTATRGTAQVLVGASPRGSLALMLTRPGARGHRRAATTSCPRTSRRSPWPCSRTGSRVKPELWMRDGPRPRTSSRSVLAHVATPRADTDRVS